MTNKKNTVLDDEDKQAFRDAVADVRPLSAEQRVSPEKKRPAPRARQRERDDQAVIQEIMSDPVDLRDVETGDELFFARPGIQLKVQRKLRRGEFSIEGELDLHGLTVAEAKQEIHAYFAECKKKHKRCIRVIHGKGLGSFQKIPVLKTYVAHWLAQRNDVMAYASARPVDGGTGALYVLLKVERQS